MEVVMSVTEFRRRLAKERSRVDRFGGQISLLVLDADRRPSHSLLLQAAIEVLSERLRTTDELGWFEHQALGVILPGTDSKGAFQVANLLCDRLPDHLPEPNFRVFTYPAENLPERRKYSGSSSGESIDRHPVFPLQDLFVEPLPLAKRVLDVVLAAMALLVLAPLLALVALLIKLTSPGPVTYSQMRMGRGRRGFSIYKFRSMYTDADRRKDELRKLNEADGPAFKLTHDPRVTPLGRILRGTCIDELPQLWNVLKGEMSLVGPRPLAWDEAVQCLRWQTSRFDVTPGLTCFWQVREQRNALPFNDWMRLDIQYVRQKSLAADIQLIWKTSRVMVGGRGI